MLSCRHAVESVGVFLGRAAAIQRCSPGGTPRLPGRKSREPGDQGTTIIEVLVAMTLLSVIAISTLSLYSTGLAAAKFVQGAEEASLLAQERLEQMKANAACNCGPLTQDREPIDPVNFPGYTWEVEAREQAPGLQLLTVHVYWRHLGKTRQVSLATYVVRPAEGP